jgi:large subunit ribosomal protein L11
MAKKVKIVLKLNLPAGKANPAPPIGPALGQHGIAIMEFCKQYNEKTKAMNGIVPALITIFEDRSFTFILKKPPVSALIKRELKLDKGSATPGRETVATLKMAQVEKIALEKMEDLNAGGRLESAKKIIAGTARSMGIKVEN